MRFSCFSILPGSAEAHVIWGGIEIRLVIAYFISDISSKKYKNPFPIAMSQSYSNPKVGRFLRHGVYLETQQHKSHCQTLCSSKVNWKNCWRSRGHVPPIAGDATGRPWYSQMDRSSLSSDSVSCCCSLGSTVYRRMLLSSSGTLVQCCIGEISRSVSCSRWHLSSWLHHWNPNNRCSTNSTRT